MLELSEGWPNNANELKKKKKVSLHWLTPTFRFRWIFTLKKRIPDFQQHCYGLSATHLHENNSSVPPQSLSF